MAKRQKRKAGQMYDPNVLLQKTRLRVDETAELMDVCEATVYRWIEQGKLDSIQTPGGQHRVSVSSLRKYL